MTMFIVNQDYDKLLSSQNYNQLIWIDCVTCTCLSPSNLLLQQQFFQKRIKALKKSCVSALQRRLRQRAAT